MSEVKLVAITKPLIEGLNTAEEFIAYTARVSNPTNQMNTLTAPKLVKYLIEHSHFSPLEMVSATVEINTTRDIARQILRHRSFVFQEFCVSGETLITTINTCGRTKKVKIKDLYKRYTAKQYADMSDWGVRIFNENTGTLERSTIKEVFYTGSKPCYKLTLECGKTIVATEEHKFFVQKNGVSGFLPLKEVTTNDFIGTNKSKYTIKFSKVKSVEYVGMTETYDMEINHETHNYIANGIVTHNSQRYADPTQLGYQVRECRLQDQKNRQNSIEINEDTVDDVEYYKTLGDIWHQYQENVMNEAQKAYKWAIDNGIAKEQARAVLPEGMTNSRLYMSGTIRSWVHYCQLRCKNGTQKEHIEIANKIKDVLSVEFPSIFSNFTE